MADSKPLVSIITPSYNSSRFIEETVKSVQAQTYDNWEMIIVDDCSKDNSREIIRQLAAQDQRIKPIDLETNGGAAVARNTAINAAKGKYIAFLDSDDLWMPDKLEKQIRFMQDNDYEFSYTGYEVMDLEGKPTGNVMSVPPVVDYKKLLRNNIIGCLTAIVDIEKTGHFQMPNIRTRQDYALWLLILKRGFKAHGLQENLAGYRLVPGSISSNKVKAAKQNWKVYREVEKLSLPYASWCFINYAVSAVLKTYFK